MRVPWPLQSLGKGHGHVTLCQALLQGQVPPGWEQAEPQRCAACGVHSLVLCLEVEALKEESCTTVLCDPDCQVHPPSLSLSNRAGAPSCPRSRHLGAQLQPPDFTSSTKNKEMEDAWKEPRGNQEEQTS